MTIPAAPFLTTAYIRFYPIRPWTLSKVDMKITRLIALFWVTATQAFVVVRDSCRTSQLSLAVELKEEPEGGEEISALSASMPGCRVKKMDELKGVKCDFGTPYEFWMTATADGALIKELRTTILKDAAKKANFPGFRKGQVPPYAQPQITQFSVQEAVVKTVQAVVDGYGLKELEGNDGQVEVHEDVKDICKGYKVGNDIQFTATLNAAFDPSKQLQTTETEDDEAVPVADES
mmetsp:Transcript_27536/g.75834  ORF Transcript_27536/g.75834 Transcript_27536/m.75834 type:complete len:234 (-) Transcript_27536:267-968(-)